MSLFDVIRPGLDAYQAQRAHRLMAGEKPGAVSRPGGDGGASGAAPAASVLTAPALPPVTGLMKARISPDTMRDMNAVKAREDSADENAAFISAVRDGLSEGRSVKWKEKELLKEIEEIKDRMEKALDGDGHALTASLSDADQELIDKARQRLRIIMETLMAALSEREMAPVEQPDTAAEAETKHAALAKAETALKGVLETLQQASPAAAAVLKPAVDGMREMIAVMRRSMPAPSAAENPLKPGPEQTPLDPDAERKQETAELEQHRRMKEAQEEKAAEAA